MDKKEQASLAWVVEQETSAMQQFKGMAVSQIGFGMLGLDIVFNDQFRLVVPDAWKVLKDGKVKFGSGDVAKVFDDPGMSLWKDEEQRVNRKLAFLNKLKCTGVNTTVDVLSFKFTNSIAIVAHRVHIKPRFWHLQKKQGDKEFSWWGPVFEGRG